MNALAYKTRSEQRLEALDALPRPLTAEEKAEKKRCLHAIDMRLWRIRKEELALAATIEAEWHQEGES